MTRTIKPTRTQSIIIVFTAVIACGSLLLALPVSSRTGVWTAPIDALFTATSAMCVTGLAVLDTYSAWSLFGQVVILVLIQIGGIGFMSIISLFAMLSGRRIGLNERQLIIQSSGLMHLGGAVRILRRIIIGTAVFEGIGIILLSLRFCPLFGVSDGIYKAVFHSVSAFCNAGLDLFGQYAPFSSLSSFSNDPVVLLTIAALSLIGSLGFLVWNDVVKHKARITQYTLHSKIVLLMTGIIILVSFLGFIAFESGGAMSEMPPNQALINTLFLSLAPRTSGFFPLDITRFSEPGKLLIMMLMFIGGGSGSTGSGIKVTTVLVLILSAMTLTRKKQHAVLFRRRIPQDAVNNANALFVMYSMVILASVLLISALEPFTLLETAFEVISALCNCGLSLGITPLLGFMSRVIITLLMIAGRVGFITVVMALHGHRAENATERVPERIQIG